MEGTAVPLAKMSEYEKIRRRARHGRSTRRGAILKSVTAPTYVLFMWADGENGDQVALIEDVRHPTKR
jgi:hypothetical protein